MAKCLNCGNVVPDGYQYCPVCGDRMDKYTDDYSHYTGTEDNTYMFSREDIDKNKGMAVISYFGPLVLIPLLVNRDSKYVRFHTIQGLNIFILGAILDVIERAGNWLFGHLLFFMNWGWYALFDVVDLVMFILIILGIVNACKGRARELPIIGRIHLLRL